MDNIIRFVLLNFLLFLLNSNLNAQVNNNDLIKESYYSVNESGKRLVSEIEYDSLSRRSKFTSFPKNKNKKTGVIEYNYFGDTLIELDRSIEFDTVKMETSLVRSDRHLLLEWRSIGFCIDGVYSKGIANSVKKFKYSADDKLQESIFYREGIDTTSHLFYTYETDTSSNTSIQHCRDASGKYLAKHINQIGLVDSKKERCESNCSKIIVVESDFPELSPTSTKSTIYIENGDTTIVTNTKTKLSEEFSTITEETINHGNSSTHRTINYYEKDFLYLKETYGWRNNKWTLNTSETHSWIEVNKIKSIKIKTYRKGELKQESESLVEYKYEEDNE